MKLQRTLQVVLAAQLTLGTLLLGIGQGSPLLPALALVAACGSLWLTDVTGKVRLKQNVATMAAVTALVIFAADLYRLGPENQLLAIANLLVYLQVVLLFQRKDLRIYWQLLMLSLLQVVVAAALSLSPLFGPLVFVYLFLGLLAMSLFFAVRESLPFQAPAAADVVTPPTSISMGGNGGMSRVEGFRPVSRENLEGATVGRDLARHVTWQAAFTLLLAMALFFIVPRFQKAPLITTALGTQRLIGYNESVELGGLGMALQDPSSVMRVWFTDSGTGLPYPIDEEPLFRGATLDTYAEKKWESSAVKERQDTRQQATRESSEIDLETVPPRIPYVLERVALEEQRESTVFSILPAYRIDSNDRCPVEFDMRRQQLIRKTRRGRLEFSLATTGLVGGRQKEIVPAMWRLGAIERERLLKLPLKEDGSDPLPRLKQFAVKTVASATNGSRMEQAKALEAALGQSTEFQYSLAAQQRNPALDPIEDFVSANKQGHCEYFATALALMLRSQGIPARMVIGFKGGEFNSLGSYYQVRMLHAHAWVEAYLEPDDLPEEFRPRLQGGWLRLDPTPGSEESAEQRTLTLAERARDWMDYGDYLWMQYVVGLDRNRQQQAVYSPLSLSGVSIRRLFTWEMWTQTIPRWLWSFTKAETWRNMAANLVSWPAIFVGGLLAGVTYLVWRLRKRLAAWLSWIGHWWRRKAAMDRRRTSRSRLVVPFYEQLEALLAKHGIRRPESQTQHEFAMAVGGQLSESPRLSTAAALPRKVVDAFYRVRFGQRALDKAETEAVERSLRELAAALAS